MINLVMTKANDRRLLYLMDNKHYTTQGKRSWFVGRKIAYAILYDGTYYGHILGGSATLHLPNRNEFLGIDQSQLNSVVNNIFYHVEKVQGKYPMRNFTSRVVEEWERLIRVDWETKYNDVVLGFETLVEPPRDGELYRRAGWAWIGTTRGRTATRIPDPDHTENWSGKRIWSDGTQKLVFCKKLD